MTRLDTIQRRILEDSEIITSFWRKYFGEKIDFTWEETPTDLPFSKEYRQSKIIETIIDESRKHLNDIIEKQFRAGDISLFVREPYNDRLVLMYSTSDLLRECDVSRVKSSNIDGKNNYCYYKLNDRLSIPNKADSNVREERGLTGWIAVTGHYLLINGEQDASNLDLLNEYRTNTRLKCSIYGTPIWGRRMSENESDPNNPKRYIGVPIKSISSSDLTIGVIRYVCPLNGAPLTVNDLAFLEEIASIISAIFNLESTKGRALRETLFAHKISRLKRNANINEFLSFMSTSFKSQITSVYLNVGKIIGNADQLRLVDAHGIVGSSVADIRDDLNDYTGETFGNSGHGLTWEVFSKKRQYPIVEKSVADADGWGGLNTSIFYTPILPLLGTHDANSDSDISSVIKGYRIKIMGMALFNNEGKAIGVVKVEFPLNFDDKKHYDDIDKEFFKKCANELTLYLNSILKILSIVNPNDIKQMDETIYLKYLTEIIRTKLIKSDEHPNFWSLHGKHIDENKDTLRHAGNIISQTYTDSMKTQLIRAISSLPETIVKEVVKYIFKGLFS
ncbi:MAG: hypothetical protein MI892_20745 [Desulfobacterales bacterium]|nr:hypothetical protein [Desulfobacterales bacterium]